VDLKGEVVKIAAAGNVTLIFLTLTAMERW
jgi:hypothetical protein